MLILALSTLACLAGVVIITWLHTRHHLDVVVTPVPPPAQGPLISVIVPARDEERNIRRCVEALLSQTWQDFEVLVLDDRSTDATPAILAELAAGDSRLQVLAGVDLPPGWAGKPHALHQAVAKARGEWLCFIDADTFAAPEALAAVHNSADETGADLFTIMTAQEMKTFWERVVLPLVFTALSVGFTPRRANDPSKPDAIANGQFIFIRRQIYVAIGGHAAIRDSIVEDKDLAVLLKRAGYRLVVADGRQVARTRMYTSLPEMWEGWTKNIFLGLKGSAGMLLLGALGAFLSLMAALVLPVWLASGLAWWLGGITLFGAGPGAGALVAAEAAALWATLIFWRILVLKDMHLPGGYALTVPLGAAVFAAMMFASTWKVLSGRGVTWKGRRYQGSVT
ncbi:MAG: glycosyltransferase [Anaerolineales bacterium]|nr:glycosyltransferase [Anaerolineales bacterium]